MTAAVVPVALLLLAPVLALLPIIVAAHEAQHPASNSSEWKQLVTSIQDSVDPMERASLYMGRVVADSSPVLLPRIVLREHAHFLGDTGGGKTALGLIPLAEQLIMGPDCSVITIELP